MFPAEGMWKLVGNLAHNKRYPSATMSNRLADQAAAFLAAAEHPDAVSPELMPAYDDGDHSNLTPEERVGDAEASEERCVASGRGNVPAHSERGQATARHVLSSLGARSRLPSGLGGI